MQVQKRHLPSIPGGIFEKKNLWSKILCGLEMSINVIVSPAFWIVRSGGKALDRDINQLICSRCGWENGRRIKLGQVVFQSYVHRRWPKQLPWTCVHKSWLLSFKAFLITVNVNWFESSILSSTSFQVCKTFWGVMSAAVEQSVGVKPRWLLRETGNSAPEADPRIPLNQ